MSQSGLAPKYPLINSVEDGPYGLIKSFKELAKQNLKTIVHTAPGERTMKPSFGVGLRQFLFEQRTAAIDQAIKQRIVSQVKLYLPYIKIINIELLPDISSPSSLRAANPDIIENLLFVKISYLIPEAAVKDSVTILPTGAPVSFEP